MYGNCVITGSASKHSNISQFLTIQVLYVVRHWSWIWRCDECIWSDLDLLFMETLSSKQLTLLKKCTRLPLSNCPSSNYSSSGRSTSYITLWVAVKDVYHILTELLLFLNNCRIEHVTVSIATRKRITNLGQRVKSGIFYCLMFVESL